VKYRVDFTHQALEDFSSPQPLKGKFQGMFKLVVGDWRIIYTADFINKLITVHLIGHRREVYKV
jgi:mRNA interferase RelE/StbE